MNETEIRTEGTPSGDPSSPAQHEGESSADVAGSAAGQAEDVQQERSAENERHRLIALAAYYRAERRGFMPGCEVEDWLGAEAETDQEASSRGG